MRKKILLGLVAVLVVVAGVAAMSAFEAHVINVTAKIENALAVSTEAIDFGTVFPQEYVERDFTVQLSESFLEEGRVDDVNYVIKQKPKPKDPEDAEFCHGKISARWDLLVTCFNSCMSGGCDSKTYKDCWEQCKLGFFTDYPAECYPFLCPWLSKMPDNEPGNGNDTGVGSPHLPGAIASGRLAKSENDLEDEWTIDLVVPCFQGMCDQDYNWCKFGPPLPPELNGEVFGCDLWIEVTGISERVPYESCTGWTDCQVIAENKDFFVTGRYGDGNPTAGAWELAIWEVDGGPETVVDQDNYGWTNNQADDFSVTYDPTTGGITFTVDGNTPLTWTYAQDKAFDYLVLFAKGDGNGNNTILSDLDVDGMSVPDVNSNDTYTGLVVYLTDAQQADGFTVTGSAKLIWGGSPANEKPAFHVFAMGTHNLPAQ